MIISLKINILIINSFGEFLWFFELFKNSFRNLEKKQKKDLT
jgi:hypothetical protein